MVVNGDEMIILRIIIIINDDIKHVFDHKRQDGLDILIGHTDVRMIIDFQEPDSKILINEEIESNKLETVGSVVRVESILDSQVGVDSNIDEPLVNHGLEVEFGVGLSDVVC